MQWWALPVEGAGGTTRLSSTKGFFARVDVAFLLPKSCCLQCAGDPEGPALSKVFCHPTGSVLNPVATPYPCRAGRSLPSLPLLRVLPSALKVVVAALPTVAVSALTVNHLFLVNNYVNSIFSVQITGDWAVTETDVVRSRFSSP